MRLKWIRCQVADARRTAFSRAQARWSTIAGTEGLLGQAGGFDLAHAGVACVAALWASDAAYRRFMAEVHDPVVASIGQEHTYDAIDVDLYDEVFPMPGATGALAGGLASAALLRAAECRVRSGREAHFETVQAEVWRPAMGAAPGMLGGSFLRGAAGAYLVLTAWASAEAHDAYATGSVSGLRARAAADDDLEEIVGRRIALEPGWSVGLASSMPGA